MVSPGQPTIVFTGEPNVNVVLHSGLQWDDAVLEPVTHCLRVPPISAAMLLFWGACNIISTRSSTMLAVPPCSRPPRACALNCFSQFLLTTATRHHVEFLQQLLAKEGIEAAYVHGNMDQARRCCCSLFSLFPCNAHYLASAASS